MTDAIKKFDGMSLSYTYENDWEFTNYFEGTTRITEVGARGILHETMAIEKLRDGIYMISWEDAEMGYITQVFDLPNKTMLASVPIEGKIEIWKAVVTQFVKGQV